MSISNVWVFAQGAEGAPTSTTLELLTKARQLGAPVTAFVAGDAGDIAGTLGEFGATKVYATGDLQGALPGRRRRRGDEGGDRRRRCARPDSVLPGLHRP